jgi:hypothetical protein
VAILSVLDDGQAHLLPPPRRAPASPRRFVVGLWLCGQFPLSGVVLISRWFPRPSWATVLSWLFALSQVGQLLADCRWRLPPRR